MAALAPDPVAFRALEHAGWQGAARHYDDAFGSLTRQAVDPLLDSAEVRSGARTLDVASGPGYAAAAAAARGARVAALDFSSAMVELARSQNPEIEFREGDAEALPFREAASTRWGGTSACRIWPSRNAPGPRPSAVCARA